MKANAFPHAEFPLGPCTPYAGNPLKRPQGDSTLGVTTYKVDDTYWRTAKADA